LRINSRMKCPTLANGSESSATVVETGDPGGPDVEALSGILSNVERPKIICPRKSQTLRQRAQGAFSLIPLRESGYDVTAARATYPKHPETAAGSRRRSLQTIVRLALP
jgi:hypothetical protein